MWVYNNERPHGSLKYHTPTDFMIKYEKRTDFPTFQQDINNDFKSIVLDIANNG